MTLEERVTAAYDELRMDLYRYVLTLGLPPQAAQDIAHDCFVRFYEVLRHGTVVEHTRPWLLRVAHNMALNTISAKGFDTDELSESTVATRTTTEDQLLERERRSRLRAEIARLSRQQRACLELRAQGLRYREIAEIMDISISAVAEFVRRAIVKLREVLD